MVLNKNDKKENVHLVPFAALILLYVYLKLGYVDMITFNPYIGGYIETCTVYCFDFFCFSASVLLYLLTSVSHEEHGSDFMDKAYVDRYILHLLFLLLLFPALVEKTLDG